MTSSGLENEESLKKQLAFAVRSIQWSYAIFWSISAREPGVLEWGEGYYNGDIKTRKTLQAVELNADELGLQRSEQLRELFESLSAGESSRRPSAALSPEDLSDAEWYYLVCMSFVFNIGQGIPGRTLTSGQPTWLYNAPFADSKVFSRSLLAKSASIQTIVCFPFSGGVIELGVSDLISEDYALVQHFKASFFEIPHPKAPPKSDHSTRLEGDELNLSSPSISSDGLDPIQPAEDSFTIEGIKSWQIMDEEFSNCDCISQSLIDPENAVSLKREITDNHPLQDQHYKGVMETLFKDSNQLVCGSHRRSLNLRSSFRRWKRGAPTEQRRDRAFSQRILKKIVSEIPRMHGGVTGEAAGDVDGDKNGVWRPEADDVGANHALSEKKRRERLNEKFSVLKTMVPSLTKDDKVSILDDAIEYLKELERRVEELESCRDSTDSERKTRTKPHDAREGTSDNYGTTKTSNGKKKPLMKKRKARGDDEVEPEIENVAVWLNDRDVTIEIRCRWRDGILLEIMDALSNARVDSHSVQSSADDETISVTIKSTVKASTSTSAVTIRQALQRVIGSC